MAISTKSTPPPGGARYQDDPFGLNAAGLVRALIAAKAELGRGAGPGGPPRHLRTRHEQREAGVRRDQNGSEWTR